MEHDDRTNQSHEQDQRVRRMLELRRQGWALRRIGDEFGLSHERVRQLLVPFPEAAAQARASRRRAAVAERRRAEDLVLASAPSLDTVFRRVHNDDVVAERFPELDRRLVKAYLRRQFATAPRRGPVAAKHWSVDEILASIIASAGPDGVATGSRYGAWRESVLARGGAAPSRPTIHNRFGSWNRAVRQAGLVPGRGRARYDRQWSDDAIEAVVARFVDDQVRTGRSLRWVRFDEWLQSQPSDSVPCAALVRVRTGDWSEYVERIRRSFGSTSVAA